MSRSEEVSLPLTRICGPGGRSCVGEQGAVPRQQRQALPDLPAPLSSSGKDARQVLRARRNWLESSARRRMVNGPGPARSGRATTVRASRRQSRRRMKRSPDRASTRISARHCISVCRICGGMQERLRSGCRVARRRAKRLRKGGRRIREHQAICHEAPKQAGRETPGGVTRRCALSRAGARMPAREGSG